MSTNSISLHHFADNFTTLVDSFNKGSLLFQNSLLLDLILISGIANDAFWLISD